MWKTDFVNLRKRITLVGSRAQYAGACALAALILAFPAPAQADGKPGKPVRASEAARVKSILSGMIPEERVQAVLGSDAKGLYQVDIGSSVMLHTTTDGKYLFIGDVVRTADQVNVSEVWRTKEAQKIARAYPSRFRIPSTKKSKTYTVFALIDVRCGYCRRLYDALSDYHAKGIRFEFAPFPLNPSDAESIKDLGSIWCSRDPVASLKSGFAGNPVVEQECNSDPSPVQAGWEAMQQLGGRGTPLLVLPNGTVLSGALPPEDLLASLQADAELATAQR